MSAELVVPGYEAKCELNGVRFALTSLDYDITRSTYNVRDSESGRYQMEGVDGEALRVNFSFQQAEDVNPHTAPYLIMDPNTDQIQATFWPRGLGFNPWGPITLTQKSFRGNWNAQSGPVGGSFSGDSFGPYIPPQDINV